MLRIGQKKKDIVVRINKSGVRCKVAYIVKIKCI